MPVGLVQCVLVVLCVCTYVAIYFIVLSGCLLAVLGMALREYGVSNLANGRVPCCRCQNRLSGEHHMIRKVSLDHMICL